MIGVAICVDPRSGEVVDLVSGGTGVFINTSLRLFTATAEAVWGMLPYYSRSAPPSERTAVAGRIGSVIRMIDPRALDPEQFWSTFVDDVAIGDFASEDLQIEGVSRQNTETWVVNRP